MFVPKELTRAHAETALCSHRQCHSAHLSPVSGCHGIWGPRQSSRARPMKYEYARKRRVVDCLPRAHVTCPSVRVVVCVCVCVCIACVVHKLRRASVKGCRARCYRIRPSGRRGEWFVQRVERANECGTDSMRPRIRAQLSGVDEGVAASQDLA